MSRKFVVRYSIYGTRKPVEKTIVVGDNAKPSFVYRQAKAQEPETNMMVTIRIFYNGKELYNGHGWSRGKTYRELFGQFY